MRVYAVTDRLTVLQLVDSVVVMMIVVVMIVVMMIVVVIIVVVMIVVVMIVVVMMVVADGVADADDTFGGHAGDTSYLAWQV